MTCFNHHASLLYLFLFFLLSCQNNIPEVPSEPASAIPVVNKNYTHQEQYEADSIASDLHSEGYYELQEKGKLHEAIENYQKALFIREDILANSTSFSDSLLRNKILLGIARSYNNLGQCYAKLGENEKAEKALVSCIQYLDELEKKYRQKHYDRKAWAYQTLGQVYIKIKDLNTTRKTFEQSMYYAYLEKSLSDVADVLNDLSWLYITWRVPDSVILNAQNAIAIYDSLNYSYAKANTQINLGMGYTLAKDFEMAKQAYNASHTYYKQDSINHIDKLSIIHEDLSFMEFERKNYPEALEEINVAIQINENRDKTNSNLNKLGKVYGFKGNIFRVLNQYDSAQVYFNKAILHFLKSSDVGITENQLQDDTLLYGHFRQIMNKVGNLGILRALDRKAKTLAAQGKHTEAGEKYEKLISLVKHTRQSFTDNTSKIQLAGIVKSIYEGAIENSYSLGDYEQAFAYSEGSKVFTLLEGIRHNKALESAVIDSNTLKAEAALKDSIAQLEADYHNEKDNARRIEINSAIQTAKAEQDKLIQLLREDKDYRKLVEEINPLSKNEIQRSVLAGGQALIEYFVGEDHTYLFLIPKKGEMTVRKIPLAQDTLDLWANTFWNSIYFSNDHSEWNELPTPLKKKYTPNDFKAAMAKMYVESGFQLFDTLLNPLINQLKEDKRLVIIPDGTLNYVPFDALLKHKPEIIGAYHSYNFLAEDFNISYCYSATLLQEMRSAKTKNGKGRILAFAPAFAGENNSYKRLDFGPLKFAKKEVETLKSLFQEDCVPYFDREATLDNFIKNIEEGAFDHVHLSTHGKANQRDPNYSFISFSQSDPDTVDNGQLLYVRDLYRMRLPVKTVVLSACETNRGIIQHGEGIMSFTRGLSYAGVQSVLSTLWSVTDKDTKDLMVHFYTNLKAGMTKDEALTKAKKSLWKNSETLHPYYWAGMIPIGSMQDRPARSNMIYFIIGGLILSLLMLLVSRRRKQFA